MSGWSRLTREAVRRIHQPACDGDPHIEVKDDGLVRVVDASGRDIYLHGRHIRMVSDLLRFADEAIEARSRLTWEDC